MLDKKLPILLSSNRDMMSLKDQPNQIMEIKISLLYIEKQILQMEKKNLDGLTLLDGLIMELMITLFFFNRDTINQKALQKKIMEKLILQLFIEKQTFQMAKNSQDGRIHLVGLIMDLMMTQFYFNKDMINQKAQLKRIMVKLIHQLYIEKLIFQMEKNSQDGQIHSDGLIMEQVMTQFYFNKVTINQKAQLKKIMVKLILQLFIEKQTFQMAKNSQAGLIHLDGQIMDPMMTPSCE